MPPRIVTRNSEESLNLLLVENSGDDAALLYQCLKKVGIPFRVQRAGTEAEFFAALKTPVDLIISDFTMVQFSAVRALEILQSLQLDIPHIIISGAINEQSAVTAMQGLEIARIRIQLGIKGTDLDLARTHLEALTIQLLNTQEQERTSLARELHDELGQRLATLKFNLRYLQSFLEESEASTVVQTMDAELALLIHQVRKISVALRPPELDYLGLEAAIRQLLTHQFEHTTIGYIFEYAGLPAKLDPAMEITVYRIVQESTTNVLRHAGANRVVVEVNGGESGTELELIVRDNGIGFKACVHSHLCQNQAGNGLRGMQERIQLLSGQFEVRTAPNQGTRITATFSLEK